MANESPKDIEGKHRCPCSKNPHHDINDCPVYCRYCCDKSDNEKFKTSLFGQSTSSIHSRNVPRDEPQRLHYHPPSRCPYLCGWCLEPLSSTHTFETCPHISRHNLRSGLKRPVCRLCKLHGPHPASLLLLGVQDDSDHKPVQRHKNIDYNHHWPQNCPWKYCLHSNCDANHLVCRKSDPKHNIERCNHCGLCGLARPYMTVPSGGGRKSHRHRHGVPKIVVTPLSDDEEEEEDRGARDSDSEVENHWRQQLRKRKRDEKEEEKEEDIRLGRHTGGNKKRKLLSRRTWEKLHPPSNHECLVSMSFLFSEWRTMVMEEMKVSCFFEHELVENDMVHWPTVGYVVAQAGEEMQRMADEARGDESTLVGRWRGLLGDMELPDGFVLFFGPPEERERMKLGELPCHGCKGEEKREEILDWSLVAFGTTETDE